MPYMTGPQHYTEGERLLAQAATILANNDETNPAAALCVAEAHAHFAAAKIALSVQRMWEDAPGALPLLKEWAEATGAPTI